MIKTFTELLNGTVTCAELDKIEHSGWNFWRLIDIMKLSDDRKKIIANMDFTSGSEKIRDKQYNESEGYLYVLSEIAHDDMLEYLLQTAKHKNRITELLFSACYELSLKRLFTSAMYYFILTRCTDKDSDKIMNAYDTDRNRGRKRAVDWIKNNM